MLGILNALSGDRILLVRRNNDRTVVSPTAKGVELVVILEVGIHVVNIPDSALLPEIPILHQDEALSSNAKGRSGACRRTGDGTAADGLVRLGVSHRVRKPCEDAEKDACERLA